MKHILKTVLMTLLVFSLTLCAAESIPEPNEDFWYLDQANVLSEETEGLIFFADQRLNDAVSGAEIVVVTVETTGNTSIDDYCYQLMNEWVIGAESQKGFLVLLAIEDGEYYTMPGVAVEAVFSSSHLLNLQDTYLKKDFDEGRYDAGVQSYFEVLYAELAEAVGADVSLDDARADYQAYLAEEVYEPEAQPGVRDDTEETEPDMGRDARGETRSPYSPYGGMQRHSYAGVGIALIVLLILLIIVLGRRRRNHYTASAMPPPADGGSGFNNGAFLGYMLGRSAFRRRSAPPPPPPHQGGFGGTRGFSQPPRSGGGIFGGTTGGSRPTGGSFGSAGRSSSSRSSGGTFGGANRSTGSRSSGSSFGGASRSFGSSSRSGFGGASRSGGRPSSGFSTRGGGAGRGGRR